MRWSWLLEAQTQSYKQAGSNSITTLELKAEVIPEPLLWPGASGSLPVFECSQGLGQFE